MSIEEIEKQQIAWHSQAKQGCIFATYLIKNSPTESKLKRFCYDEPVTSELVKKIVTDTSSAVNNDEVFVISFLLPSIKTKEDLIDFIELLKQDSDWTVQDTDRFENNALVRIRVPFNQYDDTGKPIFAWVLGFAPLDFLPITRKSPHFEIMLAVKSKQFFKDTFCKHSLTLHHPECVNRNTESDDAHLADLYMKDITDVPRKDQLLWDQSHEKKWYLLRKGNQEIDTNAKAKVTFSYPIS